MSSFNRCQCSTYYENMQKSRRHLRSSYVLVPHMHSVHTYTEAVILWNSLGMMHVCARLWCHADAFDRGARMIAYARTHTCHNNTFKFLRREHICGCCAAALTHTGYYHCDVHNQSSKVASAFEQSIRKFALKIHSDKERKTRKGH